MWHRSLKLLFFGDSWEEYHIQLEFGSIRATVQ